MRLPGLLCAALTLAQLALAPAPARAQLLPGPGFGGGPRWTPVAAARLGWSLRDSSPLVGAQLRLPVPIPVLRPSVTFGGDLIFQSGLIERQGTADVTLGVFAPLYVGAGAAVLNSVFEADAPRETKTGFSVVAGLRGGRVGPLSTELEFRWMRVAELRPRYLSFTLGYPLLGGRVDGRP